MTDSPANYRIRLTMEGGVIQSIDNIPAGTVVEVRDYDRDGDRQHPDWNEYEQAFVTTWEGEPDCFPRHAAYTATLDKDGTEDELTIRDPGGRGLAIITFWDSDAGSRSRAHGDARLILDALNGDPHAMLAGGREIAAVWVTIDVMTIRPDLDDDQSWAVLQAVRGLHRGGGGINREVIASEAERLYPQIQSTLC